MMERTVVKSRLHGGQARRRPKRLSEYGVKLQAKQKVKKIYGWREKPLRRFLKKFPLPFLELQLANVVYRCGAAPSRAAARQMIAYGRVKVNGRKVTTSSFLLREGDSVSFRGVKFNEEISPPSWMKLERKKFKVSVSRSPTPEEMEPDIDAASVTEYYAKR